MSRALAPPLSRETVADRDAWRNFDDALGVKDGARVSASRDDDEDARDDRRARDAMRTQGYIILDACTSTSEDLARGKRLATRAVALRDAGCDPTWILMSDDAWSLLARLRARFERRESFGEGLRCTYDALAWVVDPRVDRKKTSAFCPHRDRQPDDAPGSFTADGDAKYVTAWAPLGYDATPRNSCLYCIPRARDPGYFDGDPDDAAEGEDPLRAALRDKASYQYIRALPARVGDVVAFTHRLIHWGSVGDGADGEPPRINLSCGFASDDFEPAYLKKDPLYPTFEERLALIAGQLLCYHERFPSTAKELTTLKKLFDAARSSFHESYVKKVYKEFAAAAFERGDAAEAEADGGDDESGDDDAVEDALEAMLDRADDFDDDFDDFEDGVAGDAFGRADDRDDDEKEEEEEDTEDAFDRKRRRRAP